MSYLDDFIQNGTLPFVGRSVELDRLLSFWRATAVISTVPSSRWI